MKKQTKKQTAAKRQAAKPKAKSAKSKPVVSAKPKATPKSKPVVSPPPVPVTPVAEAVIRSKPVAALPAPPVGKPDHSDRDELRRIENALAEVETTLAGDTGKPVKINPVSAVLVADIVELLEELIDTASPKLSSTISRLAYVLCEVIPGLQAVSKRADITLCRKNGVTFGWDRQAEAERAVRSGKYQKSIAVS